MPDELGSEIVEKRHEFLDDAIDCVSHTSKSFKHANPLGNAGLIEGDVESKLRMTTDCPDAPARSMTGTKIQPRMEHGYEIERKGNTNETLIKTNCVECRETGSRLAGSSRSIRGLVIHSCSAFSSVRFTVCTTNHSKLRAAQRILRSQYRNQVFDGF